MNVTISAGQQNCGKVPFKVGAIGQGATNPFTKTPIPTSADNDYIVGFDMKVETGSSRIRSIDSVYVRNFLDQTKTLTYNISPAPGKGTSVTFRCPEGTGMCGLRVWGGKITGRLGIFYKSITTGAVTLGDQRGATDTASMGNFVDIMVGTNDLVTVIAGSFHTEKGGSSGDRLCPINLMSRSFAAEFAVVRSDAAKVNSCMGRSSANTAFKPQSTTCDQFMAGYCRQNDLPECACNSSKLNGSGGKYNPLCFDSKCAASGYAPSAMVTARGATCPNITNCNQIIDMRQNYGIADFTNASFAQSCGNTPPASQASPGAPGAPASPSSPVIRDQPGSVGINNQNVPKPSVYVGPSGKQETNSNMWIYIVIFVVLLIAGMIGAWFLLSDDSSDNYDNSINYNQAPEQQYTQAPEQVEESWF